MDTEPEEMLPTEEPQEDHKEKWQRAVADLENIKKRHDQEKTAIRQFGLEGLLTDLLPVVDNFYRATDHIPEEQKSSAWVTGIQYIQKNLLDVLERQGVTEIPAKPGDPFDPSRHEALEAIEDPKQPDDTIIEVKNRGYLLNGRVLRPTQVTVSKSKK